MHERTGAAGFTLIEVLLASLLLIALAAGASTVIAASIRANAASRARSMRTILAAQKLGQLRSLRWATSVAGTPPVRVAVEDVSTDLSVDPPGRLGSGLRPSPPGTLDANVTGYVDYLDSAGAWVGTGIRVPSNAAHVRRWAVSRAPGDPDNVVVLDVVVTSSSANSERVHLTTSRARR
jgi:type II secretory pathway pseudopilin PulG